MAITQWMVTLTDKPPKGKRNPIVRRYVVAAETQAEAKEAFEAELPGHLELSDHYSISDCQCRVMGARS